MTFKAVISDFGGVLTTPLIESFLAYQRETGIALEDLGAAMGRLMEQDDGRHPLFELEKGHMTEDEFTRRLGVELGRELSNMRDTYFDHLHPNEPMIAYLRGLRADGLRMALLTNNVREWEPLWRAKLPDVEELFEVIVDSAFVGMRKPEAEIYELTLSRLGDGLRFEDCLFLDDIEVNCEAARELGMTAVRFVDNDQAIAELEAALGRR
ncbi:MAG: putative hydrolase of the superfamily [Thermoleophilaceae bacterium]|nr:putative hydrolase of the superfamily [Thermoleophilaceae bacterium]